MGRDLKVTVVGDTSVGKTSLLISYTTNSFPGEHVPTVFDNYSANAIVDNEPINLGLWDTAGSAEFDELRPLSYPGSDAFIVCYSIIDQDSATEVKGKWINEINENCPDAPIILVGTKNDLRSKPEALEQLKKQGKKIVSYEQGKELASAINAYCYIECSALTQDNLQEVFQETIRAVISPKTTSSSKSEHKSDSSSSHSKKKRDKKSGGLFGKKKKESSKKEHRSKRKK